MTTMTEPTLYTTIDSPVGELLAVGDGERLRALRFVAGRRGARPRDSWRRSEGPFAPLRSQLDEYFAGRRTGFELEYELGGAEFDRRVWAELERIPYGRTESYGAIARAIGEPDAARAVGVANGRNPIAIVVPCHRVIGADGSLTGYGGGLERKRLLLELEGAMLAV
jgi:methylated-DNA-[protein]-cysteine S-methyltransferase